MNSNLDFEYFSKQINEKIKDENKKLKVYKDILKIASGFFKKISEEFRSEERN